MFIDVITFGLLLFALFKGLRNGLVVAVFSLLAFIVGMAAALKLSTLVAGWLGENTSISGRWLPVLAFLLVFLLVVFLVRLGAKAIEGALRLVMLGWLNKIGGFLFYALLYVIVYSILLFYATQLGLIKPAAISASISYPWIIHLAPAVMDGLGAVLPFFRNMFDQLESFFDGLTKEATPAP